MVCWWHWSGRAPNAAATLAFVIGNVLEDYEKPSYRNTLEGLELKYAALRVHSHYSQFDGIGTPAGYAERAVEIGMPALALTDHGTLSGHREWDRKM